jgi:phosphatidylglycerophosphate synthase
MLLPVPACVDILMRTTRRYNIAVAIGVGLASGAGMGLVAIDVLDAPFGYPLRALTAFAALLAGVVWVSGDDHAHPEVGPANYVTAIRAALVALVASAVGAPATPSMLWVLVALTIVASALDGVDGWVARRTGTTSGFGARFDMETDALLILVLSVLVWEQEKAGVWVLLCGLMRYGFVAAGWLLPWLARPLRSTSRGKAVAVGQVLGLTLALAPVVPVRFSTPVAACALATLAWSFAIDVRWLSRQTRTT